MSDDAVREQKKLLRAQARAAREARAGALGPAAAHHRTVRRTVALLALLDAHGARTVAAYTSYGTEPSTEMLLRTLVGAWGAESPAQRVLLPVLRADRDLDWVDAGTLPEPPVAPLCEGDVEPALLLGLDAVASADVVVVPALLCDRSGTRLGQGGGSYDRALTRAGAEARVVALVDDEELMPAGYLPAEEHDRPMTDVVTPAGVHVVGSR